MKNVKGHWVMLLFVFIIVSGALFLFFINQKSPKESQIHWKDLELNVSALSKISCFELVFSKFIIEYWLKYEKFPTPDETRTYISSLDLKNTKDSYYGMMKPGGGLFDHKGYEVFNNGNSILIVQYNSVDFLILPNAPQKEIGVVLYISLKDIVNAARNFPKPKNRGFIPNFLENVTKEHVDLFNHQLKWLSADNTKELVSLFKSNPNRFLDSWNNSKSLLEFNLLYDKLKNYLPAKELDMLMNLDIASLMRAFDFLTEYVLENQEKITAFSKRLEVESANTAKPRPVHQ